MISAWKRLINKSDSGPEVSSSLNGTNGVPPGIQKLDKELQRKFARGVNYNMKVVIKGDARVGKTCLFLRLKGYGFEENYNPTENLNVTSINWNYKTTDDIVKIDLWEAIDTTVKRGINYVDLKIENQIDSSSPNGGDQPVEQTLGPQMTNKPSNGIAIKSPSSSNFTITNTKLSINGCTTVPIPESARQSLAALSENLDVYERTDAVLLVMDMTKLWTFKYIQAELPRVPKHIPVLVVANHRDQGHHRTVTAEQVKAFIEGLDRSPCDGTVMYTEASMKNGFGLKLIEKFLNIPFLRLQEVSFLKQLELNRCEYMATLEELELMEEATNREYEQYLELQTIKRRQQADAMSPVNLGLRQLDESTREQIRNATMSSDMVDKSSNNVKSIESNNNTLANGQSSALAMASQNFRNDRLPSIVIGAKCPLPDTKTIRIGSNSSCGKQTKQNSQLAASKDETKAEDEIVVSDDDSDDDSDDEDEPRANPLVAGYQSDLDSDDQATANS